MPSLRVVVPPREFALVVVAGLAHRERGRCAKHDASSVVRKAVRSGPRSPRRGGICAAWERGQEGRATPQGCFRPFRPSRACISGGGHSASTATSSYAGIRTRDARFPCSRIRRLNATAAPGVGLKQAGLCQGRDAGFEVAINGGAALAHT
jgi:hypothetical protein